MRLHLHEDEPVHHQGRVLRVVGGREVSEYKKMLKRHHCAGTVKNGVAIRKLGSKPWRMLVAFDDSSGKTAIGRIDGVSFCPFCGERMEEE